MEFLAFELMVGDREIVEYVAVISPFVAVVLKERRLIRSLLKKCAVVEITLLVAVLLVVKKQLALED